jgi:hypothetical protein
MAGNSLLTAQWVARKALVRLHAKGNMVGRANKDYQSLMASPIINGVPIGTQVQVRLPFQYVGRKGAQMATENSVQRYATLVMNNQRGVDISFTSIERAMSLGNFDEQILQPGMAVVSGLIENDVTALTNQVPKFVGVGGTAVAYSTILKAEQFLTEALAPEDDNRTLTACPQHSYEFVLDNKALFSPESTISDQWLQGVISDRVAGMLAFRNTKMPSHTVGAYASSPLTNGSGGVQGNTGVGNSRADTFSLITDGWNSGATTLQAGDSFTIAGVDDVDPETKQDLGRLKQFVVQATISDTTGAITAVIAPCPIYSGAYKNVSQSIPDNAAIVLMGTTGLTVKQSLAWYRDAILFACPPMLDLSDTVKMCAAESYEGFNLRFAQQWDQNNDLLPARIDTLSGEILAYPELAVRIIS